MADIVDEESSGIVVRLRGLPTKATKEDVAEFLQEWTPRLVYLSFTARRSTGEAFVVFDTREQAEGACSKDKDIFGPKFGERYVRVCIQDDTTPADLQSLAGATKAAKPRRPHQKMDTVIKVSGLPRGITAHEVLQLFWGWQVKRGHTFVRDAPHPTAAAAAAAAATASPATTMTHSVGGTAGGSGGASSSGGASAATGGAGAGTAQGSLPATVALRAEAFIELESADAAATAVSTRHGTTITTAAGMFQLSVQRASKAEWDAVVAAGGGGGSGGGGSCVVRVGDLPPRAAPGDLLTFFKDCQVKPGGIHVQPAAEGRHSRVALVEFVSAQDAARAVERDGQQLGEAFGERCVTLELISRAEFEQDLQRLGIVASGSGSANGSTGGSSGTATQAGAAPGSLAAMPGGSTSMGMGMGMGALGMLGPLGLPPHMGLGPLGLPGMGMLPQAAAAAAGFMTPGLPPLPHGMMMPNAGFGILPGMTGWPPGQAQQPGFAPGFGAAAPHGGLFPGQAWPGMPAMRPNPATARYMVQDLTTGQKVFLDPRFNLSAYGALPPGLASCSAAATAAATFGATATGPAASQQTQAQPGARADAAAADQSENSNGGAQPDRGGTGGGGTGTTTGTGTSTPAGDNGQSSDPTPAGGVPGDVNGGSSGNGYSVAAPGPAAQGAGASTRRQASGGGDERGGSAEQVGGPDAGGQPHAPKHRHSHHHHHHHHSHHHHHYHAHNNGNGSSGDEGRTNGGSGGGSNDGSDGDGCADDDRRPAKHHHSSKAAGDNSSGNDGDDGGDAAGGSSGEGSGADNDTTPRATHFGRSRQEGPGGGAAGGACDMEEDVAAPPAAAPPAQGGLLPTGGTDSTAPDGVHKSSHSPDERSDPGSDGPLPPPLKRARSQ